MRAARRFFASTPLPGGNKHLFFAGPHVGYNFQDGPWVYGAEADLTVARYRQRSSFATLVQGPMRFTPGEVTQKLPFLGTVRARLGYDWGGVLPYLTIGYAFGRPDTKLSGTLTGPGPVGVFAIDETDRRWRSGWATGAGIEFALKPRWSIKGEYQFVSLGGGAAVTAGPIQVTSPGPAGQRATIRGNIRPQLHTFRVGIAYQF